MFDLRDQEERQKEHQKGYIKAVNETKITHYDLKEIKSESIISLKSLLEKEHYLNGVSIAGDPPLLLFRLPSKKLIKSLIPDNTRSAVSQFTGTFGSCLRFQVWFNATDRSIVCVHQGDPAFKSLEKGKFIGVFEHKGKTICSFYVDHFNTAHSKSYFISRWTDAKQHTPIVYERNAFYYEIFNFKIIKAHYQGKLQLLDWLSIGWVQVFSVLLNQVNETLINDFEEWPAKIQKTDFPEYIGRYIDILKSSPPDFASIFQFLSSVGTEIPVNEFYYYLVKLLEDNTLGENSSCPSDVFSLFLMSGRSTECGKYLTWMDNLNSTIEKLKIEPDKFTNRKYPHGSDALDTYWENIPMEARMQWGYVINGSDIPIFSIENTLLPYRDEKDKYSGWKNFKATSSLEDITSCIEETLEEAVREKKWTIPYGAVVELAVGPFVKIECYEFGYEICFVLRNKKNHFLIYFVNPREKCWYPSWFELEGQDETDKEIDLSLKLLLATIVRDFWVVEERESVFSEKLERVAKQNKSKSTRYVYLPRIKYIHSANIAKLTKDLSYTGIKSHSVVGHVRRLPKGHNPSGSRLLAAVRYGIKVPEKYTFIVPYQTGKMVRDVIYRSRSALKALYTVEVYPSDIKKRPEWFKFERDVYDLMRSLNYDVQHIASSKNGDKGVDVYATKKNKTEYEHWIIQCKCWSNNVGPNIVRELIGTLSDYPEAKGMIVTTSKFSSGAKEKAQEVGIELIDGEIFFKLANKPLN